MASFYYYDQNPFHFSFHTLIWYSQWGFENKSLNLHNKAKSWRILVVVVKWRHRANGLFTRVVTSLYTSLFSPVFYLLVSTLGKIKNLLQNTLRTGIQTSFNPFVAENTICWLTKSEIEECQEAVWEKLHIMHFASKIHYFSPPTPSLSHGLLRTGTQCFGLSADRHVPMEAALLLYWAARNLSEKDYK